MNKKIIKSFLFAVLLFGYFVSFTTPVFAGNLTCGWQALDSPGHAYDGRLAYCFGGFDSVEEFHSSEVRLPCVKNCGGLGLQIIDSVRGLFGGLFGINSSTQVVSLSGMTPVLVDGSYKQCITGPIDGSIKDTVEDCLNDKFVAAGWVAGTGGVLTVLSIGSSVLVLGGMAAMAAAAGVSTGFISDALTDCAPTIRGVTDIPGGDTCEADLIIDADLTTQEAGELYEPEDSFYAICESNLGQNPEALASCQACSSSDGIWTAVGCIEQDPKSMVQKVMTIGIGILGGVFLLRVLAAAFMLTTSQGDVKKTSEAKQMITEAIIGILFVLFSVSILQFIGSDVLQIPGFGG